MNPEHVMELVKYRIEQAEIALMDAEYLFQGKRSPQSVINRSYYAMFYSVLALLQKIGKVSPKHTGVISLFDTEFVLKNIFPKELSRILHKAYELQQLADYQSIKMPTMSMAEDMMKQSTYFVSQIKDYLFRPAE